MAEGVYRKFSGRGNLNRPIAGKAGFAGSSSGPWCSLSEVDRHRILFCCDIERFRFPNMIVKLYWLGSWTKVIFNAPNLSAAVRRWWITCRGVFQVKMVYCPGAFPFWVSQGVAMVFVRLSEENHRSIERAYF